MTRIRPYLGHVLLGLTAGVGSAYLWLRLLRAYVPLWLVGVVAVLFVLLAEVAVAEARRRHARHSRARRRAHARPHPTKIERNLS